METLRSKIWWTFNCLSKVFLELIADLWSYYVSPYPFLLIIGAVKRIRRRIKIIWCSKKSKGRPSIHQNIIDLILDMKRGNLIWGAQRISDELKVLGIFVSKKTILKILRENGLNPTKTKLSPPTWRSTLDSISRYWAMDFTTVFDVKGIQIFIFAIIEIPSRRLILINSTENPSKNWLIQQFRNCSILGEKFPSHLLHDRDGVYGSWLPDILKEFGSNSLKTAPRSPWENPHIERFNLTIKTEILNRSILVDNNHVRRLCLNYQKFYNQKRPHQGISGSIPENSQKTTAKFPDIQNLKVIKSKVMHGLVTHFTLTA